MKRSFLTMLGSGLLGVVFSIIGCTNVFADVALTVSPMNHDVLLMPGESYNGSFKLSNPASSDETLYYAAGVLPFYVNDEKRVVFEEEGSYNQITDWITIHNPSGSVTPNSSTDIYYTIDVPADAPAGGQYAVIKVASVGEDDVEDDDFSLNISVTYGIGYMIYGEVAGTTIRRGEITEINVPSFIFSGKIIGSSSVKNTGNVHSTAKYTLQIYPLFSNEEIYTNEDNPSEVTIMPDRLVYYETAWEHTPSIGMFNVVYTVEYNGITKQVKKLVIKCPIWLLFIIIFAIIALIMYFFVRSKNRKNNKKHTQSAKAE